MTTKMQAVQDMYEHTALAEPRTGDVSIVQEEQTAATVSSLSERYTEMRKAIRAYGIWMLLSAALSLLPGFDIGWAAIMLLLGLMSFYFYDAAGMLLVYAAMLLWAALSNLLAIGQGAWGFVGVAQIIWGMLAYRAYRKYRHAKAEYEAEQASQASPPAGFSNRELLMVWLAPVFGAIGMLGLCGVLPISIIYYGMTSHEPAPAVSTALAAMLELGVLGIPVGIAAIGSGHRPRAAAITGIALGTVSALIMVFGLMLMAIGAA